MKLEDDDVEQVADLLPPADAADSDIAELAFSIESAQAARLFASAASLQRIVLAGAPAVRTPPRARDVTFGFIPLGPDLADDRELRERYPVSGRFTFGGVAHVDERGEAPGQRVLGAIEHRGRRLPIVATRARLRRDVLPPHPGAPTTIGSSGCWARSTGAAAGWTHGVMTARHVVKHLAEGDAVDLDPSAAHAAPTQGKLADRGECAIDASIIAIDQADWPAGLSPLALKGPFHAPIAPSVDVVLHGRFATATRCRTLSHHPLPYYWGAMMGQRLVIDDHGQGGDSGGLVIESASGAGVGLYMGRIDDGAGGYNGLCQDLHQASVYLEAELHL